MSVQPINYYICTRCQVQGALMHTKTCWSCGKTDMLQPSSPFKAHNFTGMTMGPPHSFHGVEYTCDSQQSENWSATFAARFGGVWRGQPAQ